MHSEVERVKASFPRLSRGKEAFTRKEENYRTERSFLARAERVQTSPTSTVWPRSM